MKNRKNWASFGSGMVTAFLLTALVTTAMASSGAITFNKVNLSYNSKEVLTQGMYIQTESGTQVPGSLLYTDETGGGTTYLPVRYLFETLGMPVEWDGENKRVRVSVDGDYALHLLDTKRSSYAELESFKEVNPLTDAEGKELLESNTYLSETGAPFEVTLLPKERDGSKVTISARNLDSAHAVEFGLGTKVNGVEINLPVRIPAGETVTRSLEITDFDALSDAPIVVQIACPEEIARPLGLEVSVLQSEN